MQKLLLKRYSKNVSMALLPNDERHVSGFCSCRLKQRCISVAHKLMIIHVDQQYIEGSFALNMT